MINQVGDGIVAADTGNTLETSRRVENNPIVGEITSIVILHVNMFARGDLPQT